ncbi:hypothetical protein NKH77_52555 [Streptomyces sp. M19]
MRFPLRVASTVRAAIPAQKPVFVRITATDWADGGITLDEATTFAKELAAVGIDLLDVSSGGVSRAREARQTPERERAHVEFADTLKKTSGLAVAPVGRIGDLSRAGELVADGRADAVLMGRPCYAIRTSPCATGPMTERPGRASTTAHCDRVFRSGVGVWSHSWGAAGRPMPSPTVERTSFS